MNNNLVVTERQKRSCINDVSDYCKETGITMQQFAVNLGMSKGYFDNIRSRGFMTREAFDDCYNAMRVAEEKNDNLLDDHDLAFAILGKLQKIENKLSNTINLSDELLKYINECCELFEIDAEILLRTALAQHAVFNCRLKRSRDNYEHRTDSHLPNLKWLMDGEPYEE